MAPQSSNPPTSAAPSGGAASPQNLNQIVLEYLSKKGYSRTEAMLRRESAHQDSDGRPIITRAEDAGGAKYERAFNLTRTWIEDSLDIYKPELRRILWPIFVYSFLNLVGDYYPKESESFFAKNSVYFLREHEDDIRALSSISLPEHLDTNHTALVYRENKYRLTLSTMAYNSLILFLESKEQYGGSVIISIIHNSLTIISVERAALGNERSLAALIGRSTWDDDVPGEDEGIPGHNPGSANTEPNAPAVLAKLTLGPLPMEADLMEDVRVQLQDEDAQNPPLRGQDSLISEFEAQVKQEPSEDTPNRDNIPLPPSLQRDVVMEVQKIKENRDRFRINSRSDGVGPGLSVTMFTFHNTFDSVNCIEFSGDCRLVAAGMSESYIRVWSLDGNALRGPGPAEAADTSPPTSSSCRLVGHSGPVYSLSFSPAIAQPAGNGPSIGPRYLLSCSADKSVRLWSLETWTCLVIYKSHDNPIWDVRWGPFGHYFATASHDRTARLWSTDHISPLRIFAGHDNDVDHVTFHPNGAYIFTCSCDKTVRMWDITRGNAVRLFTGHTANVTAIACAPKGHILASADDQGSIFLWDLASGRRIKRMRGHGKGGIWSLSWSVESNVLVSGGADCTVRVWDCLQSSLESNVNANSASAAISAGQNVTVSSSATPTVNGNTSSEVAGPTAKIDGSNGTAATTTGSATAPAASTAAAGATAPGGKKGRGGKDEMISPDQISAFPTKKSPVYKVQFTNMNLVLAGGAYLP